MALAETAPAAQPVEFGLPSAEKDNDAASFVHSEDIAVPLELAHLDAAQLAATHRRALFKLDIRIMPAMFLMYFLNYLDRQNIASAKLANITDDLGLTTVQYQTCISLLFIGYILMQVPSNMVAGKTAYPALYICGAMAAWGAISACTGAVHNFAGLVVCRFFLGVVESVFLPGAIYYMSLFYSRRQMALRTAVLFSGSMVGSAFGGLFAVGILTLEGARGIAGWRWLFIVEGSMTVFIALLFAAIMPNQLHGLRGFSKDEQEYLYWNFGKDQGQQDDRDELSVLKGTRLALTDPKLWLLLGILYCTYLCGSSLNFFPSVVATLGYSRNKTYALTAPPSLLCVPVMLINGYVSDRLTSPDFAMMLMPSSFYASAIVTLSWITSSMSQPATKRAAAIAIINAAANTPNVWTSYLYYAPPRYTVAFIVNVISAGLAIVFSVGTWLYLRRQNARLDRGEDLGKNGPTVAQVAAGFRYIV
ncbi:hypothetical protein SCUCBS95973_002867 [Sporothrix curviconia]|uniref:Major facilitator superfamily (MFS) profile domain-containing protein n=1 Tax=Sporothrix curviconia TaxID=1260050 RepID=A0ABP0BAR1_9PEZI